MTVVDRIKAERERAGLSRHKLAIKAGLSKAYVSLLERGDIQTPSLCSLAKLARALGVRVEYLAFGSRPRRAA